MTSRPILFSAPMVRAILDGRKRQTRRVVKPQPKPGLSPGHMWRREDKSGFTFCCHDGDFERCEEAQRIACPYGQPGDQLWCRETWDFRPWTDRTHPNRVRVAYAADGEQREFDAPSDWDPTLYNYERWRPSIHMPRWVSRITLAVESVRVERLQDISEEDARAEGADPYTYATPDNGHLTHPYHRGFARLWDEINGKRADCRWEDNPWTWVLNFRRVQP